MTRLHERIETTLPIEAAFAYVADFANSQDWDPGVATRRADRRRAGRPSAHAIAGRPPRAAASPRWSTASRSSSPARVVLVGRARASTAVDDIRFAPRGDRHRIDYIADIRLRGCCGSLQPFLGGAFERIARDAADGMERTLAAQGRRGDREDPS